ncbi:MAG: sugar phosphate nucleotidyltransferase [Oscillospiraceae bacterium]
MKEPTLVILAAGMGSRYGGLKQIDPVDEQGHIIIDFSIYDAIEAGFKKIVFIIKKAIEKDFKEVIGDRISKYAEVAYVYQELEKIPQGISIPAERTKPWGTGHAILSCKDVVDGPFAVINADDYYGKSAYKTIYNFLSEEHDSNEYAMVGYIMENTLTDNGHVARGVCTAENGYLSGIIERTHIEKTQDGAAFTEDEGKTWTVIPKNSIVSMNLWGFETTVFEELQNGFGNFLEKGLVENPLKCEYFLPNVIGKMIEEGRATARVLKSADRWYGVTYKEDKETVVSAIKSLKEKGLYPEKLWEDK